MSGDPTPPSPPLCVLRKSIHPVSSEVSPCYRTPRLRGGRSSEARPARLWRRKLGRAPSTLVTTGPLMFKFPGPFPARLVDVRVRVRSGPSWPGTSEPPAPF